MGQAPWAVSPLIGCYHPLPPGLPSVWGPHGYGYEVDMGWKFRPHGSPDFRRRRLPIHGPHTMR